MPCFQTEYVKFLGGSDFNSAIKIIINTILDKSVQKQLSWSGMLTKKPSFKNQYKGIVDGIHVAMKETFKEYTIVNGEAKIHSMLKNAAKCKT